ncbi:MAG: hypothetical protein RSE21_01050 [Bacilli bacterium]
MDVNSLIPIIIISLYIAIIFLIDKYRNIKINEIENNINIDINKQEPIINFYCYNNLKIKNLFWLTFLDLINKNYYKLTTKDDETYVEWTKQNILKFDEINLITSYKIVIKYINCLIYKETESSKISLSKLDYLVKTDFSLSNNINRFNDELIKDVKKIYGNIDKISDYVIGFFFGVLYFMQVLFFISNSFKFIELILLSIPLSLANLYLSYKFKNKIYNYDKKKTIKIILISLFVSTLSCILWINLNSFNYIIFHVLMAVLTFMYPLFLFLNIYFINSNRYYKNKLQRDAVKKLGNLKMALISNNLDKEKNYVYVVGFKIKHKFKNKCLNDIISTFKI